MDLNKLFQTMVDYIYRKQTIHQICSISFWETFLSNHKDICGKLTSTELMIKFYGELLANVNNYNFETISQKNYFLHRFTTEQYEKLTKITNNEAQPLIHFQSNIEKLTVTDPIQATTSAAVSEAKIRSNHQLQWEKYDKIDYCFSYMLCTEIERNEGILLSFDEILSRLWECRRNQRQITPRNPNLRPKKYIKLTKMRRQCMEIHRKRLHSHRSITPTIELTPQHSPLPVMHSSLNENN